ncbi:MAG: DNA alkylation repair protein [Bacteroidetes bacterium]|nr:DNA alkylation repair protein [Bacteroidota bacterium]
MQSGTEFRTVFNLTAVGAFAREIRRVWPDFDDSGFQRRIAAELDALSFSQRATLIAEALGEFLPGEFPAAVNILLGALGPELAVPDLKGSTGGGATADAEARPGVTGIMVVPMAEFVGRRGLGHFDLGMQALREMTKRLTAEWAIRPFIVAHPERALRTLRKWAADGNPHVRRLVSEGTRPRLPWATRLPAFQADPRPVLALLELLKQDPELYVRRSVANNLNDIAKDHPDLVVETLRRWQRSDEAGTRWIIGHALRTLLKQGHPAALELQGYGAAPRLAIQDLAVTPTRVTIGGETTLRCVLVSTAGTSQSLLIDFIVFFVKANGGRSPKVFKLTKRLLPPGETLVIEKRIPFQAVSTRKYYPGPHRLELQVNGVIVGGVEFEMREGECPA